MSILIRGMEMPTGERPVHIEIHRDGTVLQWKFNESDEIIGTAVEVPPHGDLIDKKNLSDDLQRRWNVSDDQDFCNKEVWHALEEAPTIIERED